MTTEDPMFNLDAPEWEVREEDHANVRDVLSMIAQATDAKSGAVVAAIRARRKIDKEFVTILCLARQASDERSMLIPLAIVLHPNALDEYENPHLTEESRTH